MDLNSSASLTELAERIGRLDARLFVKKVVPQAEEREHTEVYAQILNIGCSS